MPIAKPCPKSCPFNWVEFHKQLDIATAHLIDEAGPDTPGEDYLPSKVSLMKFLEYSNAKRLLQERGQYAPEDTDATT